MSQSDVETARRHLNKAGEIVGEKEWNHPKQKYHFIDDLAQSRGTRRVWLGRNGSPVAAVLYGTH